MPFLVKSRPVARSAHSFYRQRQFHGHGCDANLSLKFAGILFLGNDRMLEPRLAVKKPIGHPGVSIAITAIQQFVGGGAPMRFNRLSGNRHRRRCHNKNRSVQPKHHQKYHRRFQKARVRSRGKSRCAHAGAYGPRRKKAAAGISILYC